MIDLLTRAIEREKASDTRNMNRLIAKKCESLQGIEYTDEGMAKVNAAIKEAMREYQALVAITPSVMLAWIIACENNFTAGACSKHRISIRFELPTGKVAK